MADSSNLLLIAVFVLLAGHGAAASPAKTSNSAKSMKWDTKSEAMFVHLLCADGEYFRECFSTDQKVCEQAMLTEARKCDGAITPAKRSTLKGEVELFADIGVCVGINIEKKWRDRKATTTKCDRKENWQ